MKLIYICSNCDNEIKRPVKEGEKILMGYVMCEKCGEKIVQFKIKR